MEFTTLKAEPDGDEVRVESHNGAKHLVAPVVMVREGVLNGGYLPQDAIHESIPGWNGRPVTAPPDMDSSGHPTEDGEFVSANQQAFLESMKVGFIQNPEATDDLPEPDDEDSPMSTFGARAEVWVNLERASELGEAATEAARRLAEGEELEVSTGYFHKRVDRPGSFNGARYDHEQFGLMPDHLALLPNERGACSWSDGCGAPRVNEVRETLAVEAGGQDGGTAQAGAGGDHSHEFVACSACTPGPCSCGDHEPATMYEHLYHGSANANAEPRVPEYSGTESGDWSAVDLSFEAFRDAYADDNPDAATWTDLSASDRTAISARSLNGDPEANTFSEGVVLPVVNPATDNLHEGGLDAALSRAPQTEGINVEETQETIGSLLLDEFEREVPSFDSNTDGILARIRALVNEATGGSGTTNGDNDNDTMTDHDYETLADELGVAVETLESMDDDEVESLASNVDATNDGDGGDGGDDDGSTDHGEVEALREQVEDLTDTVQDLAEAQNSDPRADEAREFLAENSDHGEDDLAEWPDEAVLDAAQARGFAAQGYAAPPADRVNRLGQGGGGAPTANAGGEDEDPAEYVESAGAFNQLDAAESGGD